MASGSFECSPSGALQCKVEWNSVASGSIDNYSTVTVRVYARRTDSYTTTGTFKGWACIENSSSQSVGEHYGGVSSGWVLIHTHSGRVNHNSNGSKSVTIYGSVTGPSGTSLAGKTSTGSQTVTLDKINRYPVISSATNFTDEENPSMTFQNYGTFPIRVKLEAGGNSKLIIRDIPISSTSYTFELTDAERNTLRQLTPNSNTLPVILTVCAMNGETELSASYLNRTMTIVNANPTFSNFDFNDINPITLALTGNSKYNINGYSTIKAIISTTNKAVAKKSATMSTYRFTCGDKTSQDNMTYSASQEVSGTIKGTPNGAYNVYATDSRNNTTLVTKLATKVIEYTPIYIDRQNAVVNRDNGGVGDNVILTYSGTIWSNSFGVKSNSIKSASYRFKKTTDNKWIPGKTNITPTVDGNKFTFEALVSSDNSNHTFDLDASYDFEITIEDQLSTDTFKLTPVGSAVPNLALADNGVGIMGAYDEEVGGKLQVGGKCFDKNIMTIYSDKRFTMTTNPLNKVSGLTSYISVGDKLKYSDSSIVIGKGVSKVLVSVNFSLWKMTKHNQSQLAIFKNDSEYAKIWFVSTQEGGYTDGIVIAPILMNVKEGDVISLFIFTGEEQTIEVLAEEKATYLTVMVVE